MLNFLFSLLVENNGNGDSSSSTRHEDMKNRHENGKIAALFEKDLIEITANENEWVQVTACGDESFFSTGGICNEYVKIETKSMESKRREIIRKILQSYIDKLSLESASASSPLRAKIPSSKLKTEAKSSISNKSPSAGNFDVMKRKRSLSVNLPVKQPRKSNHSL